MHAHRHGHMHAHRHTRTCTCTPTPSHIPPSPGAGGTWSLTFVQETCQIEGIFKKDLKESTEELHVSEITRQSDTCSGLQRETRVGRYFLFTPYPPGVCPIPGSLPGDLPRGQILSSCSRGTNCQPRRWWRGRGSTGTVVSILFLKQVELRREIH